MDQVASAVGAEAKLAPLLATEALTKRFGPLAACDHISLDIRAGEVHALLGENGAGKSTLVKMLYGALAPDEGRILWQGSPVAITQPGGGAAARHRHGLPAFFAVRGADASPRTSRCALPPRGRRELAETIRNVSRELRPAARSRRGHRRPFGRRAAAGGDRALPAAGAAAHHHGRADLGADAAGGRPALRHAAAALLGGRRHPLHHAPALRSAGALADRATILRRGKLVATADPKKESAKSLARMMVGAEVAGIERPGRPEPGRGRGSC